LAAERETERGRKREIHSPSPLSFSLSRVGDPINSRGVGEKEREGEKREESERE